MSEVQITKRDELAQAVKQDQEERVKRCKEKIEAILKEEKCVLFSRIGLDELAPGKFAITGDPGIRAL